MARRRVILYGQSVILGTVGASLERYLDLEIIPPLPPLPDVEGLAALAPDVILFDASIKYPDAAFTLLKYYPNLLLIGVNPENAQLMVWASDQDSALTTEDLVRVICQGAAPVNLQVRYAQEAKDSPAAFNPEPAPRRPSSSDEAIQGLIV